MISILGRGGWRADSNANLTQLLDTPESRQMKGSPKLRMFQIGAPPKRGEGLRIGATRRPPRGVPKSRWRQDDYFDIWLPEISPSAALLRRYRNSEWGDASVRAKFFDAYERELGQAPAHHVIQLLASLARRTPVAVGCFCREESLCHRSRLYKVLRRAASTKV